MNQTQIKDMQKKIGALPDGFWGPNSIASCQAYLRKMMPNPHPFPRQREVTEFYGPHGKKGGHSPPMKLITLPYTVYFEGTPLPAIRAHEKVADSLLRVFQRLYEIYPEPEEQTEAGANVFDGVYNPRPIRGGSSWSMHSWAIAIDLDADRNGNMVNWPNRAHMPLETFEAFAKEGWMCAGAFWSRDAMHMQATQA